MMKRFPAIVFLGLATLGGGEAAPTRLKELVTLEGARDNQLMGYGLVVGLAGTGDRRQTIFSAQSLANLLQRMGLSVTSSAIQVKNTAAVMVTGTLPPYGQPGSRIDVTIAAIGDASSLQGGILLMTSLKGADSQVYAVAQGPAVLGGLAAGTGGNSQAVNHPTVGRVPNGAIIERPSPCLAPASELHLQLRHADFTTAARIAESINKRFASTARADNAALVSVVVPSEFQKRTTEFVSEVERLTVEADRVQRVIINERTGTIVMGSDVRIAPVAVMHGNLTVEVKTVMEVSQPNPVSGGATQVVPQASVSVKEQAARNLILTEGATVEELVRALASIGSTPRDIVAVIQSLKSAGALDAELEII